MSLQIQNGEHVRSHTAAQSEGRCTGHPTWGIPCWDWPPWLNSSRSTRLARAGPSLGSRVLVSVHSLCVVQRAAEELGMPNSKLVVYFTTVDIRKKTVYSPKKLSLDLLEDSCTTTGCNIVQSCMPSTTRPETEGFPATDRTERRSPPRDHRGFKGLSRGKEVHE